MRITLLSLTTLLAACGGDGGADTDPTETDGPAASSLSGFYETRKQYENESDCDGRGDEVIPIPVVKLEETSTELLVTFCPTTDACPPTPDYDWSFTRNGTEWEGATANGYVSEQDGICIKILTRRTFKQEGDEVTLTRKEFRQFEPGITNEDRCLESAQEWDGSGEDQCSSDSVIAVKL